MKHVESNEYYTCDRCGKTINFIPRMQYYPYKTDDLKISLCFSDYEKSQEIVRRICVEGFSDPRELPIEMRKYWKRVPKQIHLCRRCRRDFDKFLKMRA